MNIRWKQIGETTQIRDEDSVRQMMEVVEDDDHFGEIAQLRLESFEQGPSESTSVQRREIREVGEIRVDATQPEEESLGEPHRIVVVDANVQPDKGHLRMSGGPLSKQHRLSRSGRRNDQRQWADQRIVQPFPEGGTVDGACWRDRWWSHE